MKKVFPLLFCSAGLLFAGAQVPGHKEGDGHQHAASQSGTAAEDSFLLKEAEFDFGKIPQGKPVYHSFEFINKGKTAVKMDNVQVSCGCTTPEWSQEPVAPGKTTRVRIGFNAATEGYFEKYVTVLYDNNTRSKQIKIKGTVWKAPDGPAPANASVELLKKQNF